MRRNSSTESHLPNPSVGGRRLPLFLLSDQAEEDQYIFTSLRFDPNAKLCKLDSKSCKETRQAYLFKYHYDRLHDAAGHRGWYDAQKASGMRKPQDLFNRIQAAVQDFQRNSKDQTHKGAFKVKVMVRYHGNIECKVFEDISPYRQPLLYPTSLEPFKHPHPAARRCAHFKVVLDALPTNRSLHTRDKTEWRHMYDYARLGCDIQSFQDAKEVLLFNSDGEIMDGSITTPYFYRNGKWVTPHNSCGGQVGTTRRWAIDQSLCWLGTVKVDSLRHGETIWLSNAVKGFFTAKFVDDARKCRAPSFRSTSLSSGSTAAETPIMEMSPKAVL